MFADADLIGAPIRVIVSPRNLKNNAVEITTRDKSINTTVDVFTFMFPHPRFIVFCNIQTGAKIPIQNHGIF